MSPREKSVLYVARNALVLLADLLRVPCRPNCLEKSFADSWMSSEKLDKA